MDFSLYNEYSHTLLIYRDYRFFVQKEAQSSEALAESAPSAPGFLTGFVPPGCF